MVIFDRISGADIGESSDVVTQPMIDFRMRGGGFFIQLDAEPGAVGRIHEPILELHFLVDHILAPRHIVEQCLVDAVAGSGNAKRKRDGVGDRTGRIMRTERYVMGVANGGDLLHSGKSTGVRRVGLEVVAGTEFDGIHDLLCGKQSLTAGDRRTYA